MDRIVNRERKEIGYLQGSLICVGDACSSILGSIEGDRVFTWRRIPVGWRCGRLLLDYAGRLVASIVSDDGSGADLPEEAAPVWSWVTWEQYLPEPHGDGSLR